MSSSGRRLPDNEWLSRAADGELLPGDYGRCWMIGQEVWDWFVCCPDGSTTRLWINEDDKNGHRHYITEHEDGSITVGGSVLGGNVVPVVALIGDMSARPFWHGYLDHGEWRSI